MQSEGALSSVWDEHVTAEFTAKDADLAVATMTEESYVNLIPLMIGARGRDDVREFYATTSCPNCRPTWRSSRSRGRSGRARWLMS